jgi:transcriptional regulator with XRE-family HTH domain
MATILEISRTQDVLRELGQRIRQVRLARNETVARVAERAGVGITTVQRLETGRNSSMESLIRVLRALGRLQALDALLAGGDALPSPRAIAQLGGKERVRASGKRRDG